MFSGGIKRNQWHEMSQKAFSRDLIKIPKIQCVGVINFETSCRIK